MLTQLIWTPECSSLQREEKLAIELIIVRCADNFLVTDHSELVSIVGGDFLSDLGELLKRSLLGV